MIDQVLLLEFVELLVLYSTEGKPSSTNFLWGRGHEGRPLVSATNEIRTTVSNIVVQYVLNLIGNSYWNLIQKT